MTLEEEHVRHLRETLLVLQDLLREILMYDSLKSESEDKLNFFRVFSGCLMSISVIEWWKVFGNDSDSCHWKRIIPQAEHDSLRDEFNSALSNFDC